MEASTPIDATGADAAPAVPAVAPAAATTTPMQTLSNESRKVVVHNVEKYLRPKNLKKLLDSWLADAQSSSDSAIQSIKIDKTKSPNGKEWMHVWVEDDGMVEPFLRLINDTERKTKYGKVMYAKRHDGTHNDTSNGDGGGKGGTKRGRDDSEKDDTGKRARTDDNRRGGANENDDDKPKTEDDVRDKLTPYWRMPYSDQLVRKKMELIKRSAQKIIKGVKQRFRTLEKEARQHRRERPPQVYEWCRSKRGINIQDVRPTPQTIGYRNKSEFTFGYRNVPSEKEGEDPARIPSVGFLPFGWKSDVALPHGLQNMPTEMCGIADIFNEFVSVAIVNCAFFLLSACCCHINIYICVAATVAIVHSYCWSCCLLSILYQYISCDDCVFLTQYYIVVLNVLSYDSFAIVLYHRIFLASTEECGGPSRYGAAPEQAR